MTLTLYKTSPFDLPEDTKKENPQKRKGDGASQGPCTKVPKTSTEFSRPPSSSGSVQGGFDFTAVPHSTPAHTSAPSSFASTDPQPSVFSFASSPSERVKASNQSLNKKASKESNSNYCPPSVSSDVNTDNDTTAPTTAPPLTSPEDLRNLNSSISGSENGNSVHEAHKKPVGSSSSTPMTSSQESSPETVSASPATHSNSSSKFSGLGPEGTATTPSSKSTFNSKLEASHVLGLARTKYDEALQSAVSKRRNRVKCTADWGLAILDQRSIEEKVEISETVVVKARKAREKAWQKLSSGNAPATLFPTPKEIIAHQQDWSRLLGLACTTYTEALESEMQVSENLFNTKLKTQSARQKETNAKKEEALADKAVNDAERAFEEAWTKLSSDKGDQ
ncbi:hypothetical protein G7Y79_00019g046800 [Physcia stellaris]|nr:hypothetical protein G7Y79_00019g046800 [Physcia stellaris]